MGESFETSGRLGCTDGTNCDQWQDQERLNNRSENIVETWLPILEGRNRWASGRSCRRNYLGSLQERSSSF